MAEVAAHHLPGHTKLSGDLSDRRPSPAQFMDPLELLDATPSLRECGVLSRRDRSRRRRRYLGSWLRGRRGVGLVASRCVNAAIRIGIGGFEGLRDDRQMALEQTFDGLAHVLQEVPSIGDLLGIGCASEAALE